MSELEYQAHGGRWKHLVRAHGALLALAALCIIAVAIFPSLASVKIVMDLLQGYSMVGLAALGMTFVVLTGGIDLSVGAVAAVCGFVAALLEDQFWLLPILAPVAAGAAMGAVNGLVITKLKAPPFIATLAMMSGAGGLALIINNEKPVVLQNTDTVLYSVGHNSTLGVPDQVWIFAVIAAVCIIISKYTRFGRSLFAVGGNEEAARMMGFNPGRVKFLAYTISGTLSGVAGMMLCSRLAVAQPAAGGTWMLMALAAVVIGGTMLAGGRGSFSGTVYGILIYAVIELLLGRFSLMVWWINILTGVLLLCVVISQYRGTHVYARKRKRSGIKQMKGGAEEHE